MEACFGTGAGAVALHGTLPYTKAEWLPYARTTAAADKTRVHLWEPVSAQVPGRLPFTGPGRTQKPEWLQYARTATADKAKVHVGTGAGADAQADAACCGPHEGPCCKTRGLRARPT